MQSVNTAATQTPMVRDTLGVAVPAIASQASELMAIPSSSLAYTVPAPVVAVRQINRDPVRANIPDLHVKAVGNRKFRTVRAKREIVRDAGEAEALPSRVRMTNDDRPFETSGGDPLSVRAKADAHYAFSVSSQTATHR